MTNTLLPKLIDCRYAVKHSKRFSSDMEQEIRSGVTYRVNDEPLIFEKFSDDYREMIFRTTNYLLDGILTKKNIILSMIYGINSCHLHLGTLFVQRRIAILLAHVFKKFPELWKMSWMFAKFKDNTTKKWTKYHRLGAYLSDISKQYSYTHPNECYDKFIETYFKCD